MAQVQKASGSMAEKTQWLKEAGVFDAYRQIHKDYVKLAVDGDSEALKRAVFIQWLAAMEPGCFTGIPGSGFWSGGRGLDAAVEKQGLALAERYYFSADVDAEFKWMLAWYYSLADYYFAHFLGDSALVKALYESKAETQLWGGQVPSRASLENRGQMSAYWLSLLKSR